MWKGQLPSFPVFLTDLRRIIARLAENFRQLFFLQHFRHYLLSTKVILLTDHHTRSLKWLKTLKRPERILVRYIETLAEYNYDVKHRPGRLHSNADAVLRQACKQCWGRVAPPTWIDECERAEEAVDLLSVHTLQLLPEFTHLDFAEKQAEDPEIGDAYRVLQERESFPRRTAFVSFGVPPATVLTA